MAIALAYWPLRQRAGLAMFACVFGFGAFTIVFGVSRNLGLSIVALVLVGASDMVSVICLSASSCAKSAPASDEASTLRSSGRRLPKRGPRRFRSACTE